MAAHGEVAGGWRKSSGSNPGECVEVLIREDHVHVRHSQDRQGPALTFTHAEWRAFVTGVRLGEFDVPATTPARG